MNALLIVLAFLCFLVMGSSIEYIGKDWGRTLFNISTTIFMLAIVLLFVG